LDNEPRLQQSIYCRNPSCRKPVRICRDRGECQYRGWVHISSEQHACSPGSVSVAEPAPPGSGEVCQPPRQWLVLLGSGEDDGVFSLIPDATGFDLMSRDEAARVAAVGNDRAVRAGRSPRYVVAAVRIEACEACVKG